MYPIHPSISHQLVQERLQDLHRVAGNTRLHRELIHRRGRVRRRP
jgi:hypothetical protein